MKKVGATNLGKDAKVYLEISPCKTDLPPVMIPLLRSLPLSK